MITVSAFKMLPPIAQGLSRDLRVRWALEEAQIPYEAKLISFDDQKTESYLALQPFGQVPVLEENGASFFESGSIVIHIGKKSEVLLPADPVKRDRAVGWVFASLNTMEIVVASLVELDLFHADKEWAKLRRPDLESAVKKRLSQLATWLGDRDYLEGTFSAGDLMMTTVLRSLNRTTKLLDDQPRLKAYVERCEARPAFQRALKAHMSTFQKPS